MGSHRHQRNFIALAHKCDPLQPGRGGGSGGHCLGGSPSLRSDECDPLQPGREGRGRRPLPLIAPRHYAGDRQNAEPDPRGRDGMPPAKAGGRAMPTGHKRDVRDWPHRAQKGRERRRGSSSAPPASAGASVPASRGVRPSSFLPEDDFPP